MKITNQTVDKIVLKDNNFGSSVVNLVFMLAIISIAYFWLPIFRDLGNLAFLFISIIFLVAIVTFLFKSRRMFEFSSVSVIINKSSKQIIYTKRRIIISKQVTYNINNVLRVETRKSWLSIGAAGTTIPPMACVVPVSQSYIILKDGSEVSLNVIHAPSFNLIKFGPIVIMANQAKISILAAQMASFLGVPFQEIAPPNLSSSTCIGKVISVG